MRIEIIKIKELISFLDSECFINLREIPITPLRAISQANNPRASQNDIALLIAFDDKNEITSYIGYLPDVVYVNGKAQKIYTNSCWWAKKDCIENGALQLFFLGCKLTNNQLYFPELTPHTEKIVANFKNFALTHFDNGLCGYLRSDLASILPSKNRLFFRLTRLLKMFDSIVNLSAKPIEWIWKRKCSKQKLQYEIVETIDDEISTFITLKNRDELFRRNREELNWVLNFPWVTINPIENDKKYAFTHTVDRFKNIPVKVYDNSQLVAFFILLQHNNNAHLTYFYCDSMATSNVLKIIYNLLMQQNIASFVSFHNELNRFLLNNRHPFIHLRKRRKTVAFYKELTPLVNQKTIQHGDGDCAFI